MVLAFPALADDIALRLKNGDRVSGSLVSESGSEVTLTTSFAGKISVQKSEIQERTALPSKANPAPTASPASPAPAATTATTNKVAQAPKPVVPPKVEPPKSEPPKPAAPTGFQKFLSEWTGEAELGLNLGFSTTDRQNYSGRLKAVETHVMPSQRILRNTFDYIFTYGRTEGALVDNRMDGSLKTEYELGKRWLLYNSVGAGYDEIRHIDLEYDLGPGVGYKLITRTNFVLKTELGANYQRQYLKDTSDQSRYSMRVAEDSWWQVTSKIRFDEKLEIFPEVTSLADYRIRGEANLSYLLRNNLALKLTVIDLYETNPAPGVSNNDLQIRSSIGLKF